MPKKYKSVLYLALLVSFMAGLFFSLNPAEASVACHWYKKYKKEFHNKKDKARFFKIKWLEKNESDTYFFYKEFCDAHKFDSDAELAKLSEKNQDMCRQYWAHEGYENYLDYKDDCHDNDGNEVAPAPVVGPGFGPGPMIII